MNIIEDRRIEAAAIAAHRAKEKAKRNAIEKIASDYNTVSSKVLTPEDNSFLRHLVKTSTGKKEYICNKTLLLTYRARIDINAYTEWLLCMSTDRGLGMGALKVHAVGDVVHIVVGWDGEFRSRSPKAFDYAGSRPAVRFLRIPEDFSRFSEYLSSQGAHAV